MTAYYTPEELRWLAEKHGDNFLDFPAATSAKTKNDRYFWQSTVLIGGVILATIVFGLAAAYADDRTTCPSPDPCTIVLLTDAEKKILLDDKGILATAAQARQLDLGALATYFQQKITKAPAGDPAKPSNIAPSPAAQLSGDRSNDTGASIPPKPAEPSK